MHSLFPVPIGLYSMARWLFAFIGDLPDECLPTMEEIPVEAFAVRCNMHAAPRDDHMSHLEGVTPLTWQYMTVKRVVKLSTGVCDFSC